MPGTTTARYPMDNLRITEIKAFVPARDFVLSKRFYQDLGFTLASEGGGVAYLHRGPVSFLLQDFYVDVLADNFMMHILVEDVDAWRRHVDASGVAATYGVRVTDVELQPWRMRDFCLFDPSGVLWRIGQNVA
ncbi:MAG: VOC family protein [Aquabacterium sp.]